MRHLLPLLVVLLGLAACETTSTSLSVTNRAAVPLEQVTVSGPGFQQSLGAIAPGGTATVEVRPSGESGVGISFIAGDQSVSLPLQGYFEGGGGYAVTVVVSPDLEVAVDAKLLTY